MQPVEHQIPHVHDVGPFERHDDIAARVTGSVVFGHDRLVPDHRPPFISKRRVGIGLVGLGVLLFGRPPLPGRAVLVGDDRPDNRLKRLVPGRVIAMVMRVNQQVDRSLGPLRDPVDAGLRGLDSRSPDHRGATSHRVAAPIRLTKTC